MAFSINRATILGNVTKDPTVRYTQSGITVCSFSVATNHSIKQPDGTYKDIPTFHNVIVWGKTGEFISRDSKKGTKIYVEGRIQNRSYTDKNGVIKYTSEIVADQAIPMSQRNKSDDAEDLTTPNQATDINVDEFDKFVQEQDGKKDGDVPF